MNETKSKGFLSWVWFIFQMLIALPFLLLELILLVYMIDLYGYELYEHYRETFFVLLISTIIFIIFFVILLFLILSSIMEKFNVFKKLGKRFPILYKKRAGMAFLVLLVLSLALVAFVYYVLFNIPDTPGFQASQCSLSLGIACIDFRITSATSTVEIVLRNGMGFDLTSMTISISECPSLTGQSLANGTQKLYALTDCTGLKAGKKVNRQLNLTYTNSDTGLTNKTQGIINSRAD